MSQVWLWLYYRIPRRVRCLIGWHTVAFDDRAAVAGGPVCVYCGTVWGR